MGGGGSKKKSKITEHDKAVLELKTTRDKLSQYRKQCTSVIDRETEIAKTLLKQGKKKQAVLALKKKKYQELLFGQSRRRIRECSKVD